jgi:hypothetical protein
MANSAHIATATAAPMNNRRSQAPALGTASIALTLPMYQRS